MAVGHCSSDLIPKSPNDAGPEERYKCRDGSDVVAFHILWPAGKDPEKNLALSVVACGSRIVSHASLSRGWFALAKSHVYKYVTNYIVTYCTHLHVSK